MKRFVKKIVVYFKTKVVLFITLRTSTHVYSSSMCFSVSAILFSSLTSQKLYIYYHKSIFS